MRMDPRPPLSAADVVNTHPARRLARVRREYGEERFAARIADAVVRERAKEPVTSSARLAEIGRAAIPAATRRSGGHPAKHTSQAPRPEVKAEPETLTRAMPPSPAA